MTDRPLRATVHQKTVLFGPERDVLLLRDPEEGWEFPGGRLGVEERPVEGLRREVREETGLEVDVGRPVHTAAWRSSGSGKGRFAVIYRCTTAHREVRLSNEHVDYRWVDPDDAPRLLNDRQAAALERALEGSR